MRIRSSFRALIALLIAVAMLAAACGGSDDESADDIVEQQLTDDDTSAGDDAAGDDMADDDVAGDDVADDETAEDDTAEEPANDTPTSGGGDVALFCARYAENDALFDDIDIFDPAQVESWITTSRGLLSEAIADAPGELVADLMTIEESFGEMAAVLEAAEYDFFAVSEEEMDATESADADAAGDRLDAWVEANCPEIDTDESLTDDLTTPEGLEAILGSEAGRDAFIEGFVQSTGLGEDQAECVIDNLDVDLMSQLANDPEAIDGANALDLLEVFETCGIDFTQLAG